MGSGTNQDVAAHEAAHAVFAVLADLEIEVRMIWDRRWGDCGPTKQPPRSPDLRDIAMAVAGSCIDGIRRDVKDEHGQLVLDRLQGGDLQLADAFAISMWGDHDAPNTVKIAKTQRGILPLLLDANFGQAIDRVAAKLLDEAERKGAGVEARLQHSAVLDALAGSPRDEMTAELSRILEVVQRSF
jgi:hypothetical protein